MNDSAGTLPFREKQEVRVRAALVGERIDIRALEPTSRLADSPAVVAAGESGCAVLFRYGAAVMFGLTPVEEAAFLSHLRTLVQGQFPQVDTEEAVLRIDSQFKEERVANGVIQFSAASIERVQIVADALAKSVVLAHYERDVGTAFDRIEPLAENLEKYGSFRTEGHELLKHLGNTLRIQQKVVGRVEVVEKPDMLWDRPELERLFLRLLDEYELPDRQAALGRKLKLISSTTETVLNLLQQRHSLRLEWYIVVLIVVEIGLTIIEMFRQH